MVPQFSEAPNLIQCHFCHILSKADQVLFKADHETRPDSLHEEIDSTFRWTELQIICGHVHDLPQISSKRNSL